MDNPKSYCKSVKNLDISDINRVYHDTQYGFPIISDNELFGRLLLEINQAGLSWTTILNKQANFKKAYSEFNIQKVANYTEKDKKRLLGDIGIIRNKLKINAAIYNAQKIIEIQEAYGSFKTWLDKQSPLTIEEWVKLFKKTFKFTGGEITKEFLLSTGYIRGSHEKKCPIYNKILLTKPIWSKFIK